MINRFALNNRGYYLSFTAISMLLISTLLIFLVLPQTLRMLSASESSKDIISEYQKMRNLDERISALMLRNPSLVGAVEFEDGIYESIFISEVESNNESISTSSTHFEVKNATDLTIVLDVVVSDPENDWYSVDLMYEGDTVGSFSGDMLFLPASSFYNPSNGETNYGDYEIRVNSSIGVSISHNTNYDLLKERIVTIEYNDDLRNVYFNFE